MIKQYKGHYDITLQTLRLKDQNGNTPVFFFACSTMADRCAGKTYSSAKMLLKNYFSHGKYLQNIINDPIYKARSGKFILFTRRITDLGKIATGVFSDVLAFEKEFEGYTIQEITTDKISKIVLTHYEDFVDYDKDGNPKEPEEKRIDEEIGWVVPVAVKSDLFKRIGKTLFEADVMYFDEFQPTKDGEYLPNEVKDFWIIYETVARGHDPDDTTNDGGDSRYIPVILCSNTISIDNPYYYYTNLAGNIDSNTKIYRGNRVVYERCTVEGLADKRKEAPINVALARLIEEEANNTYVNDDHSLVAKPDQKWGRALYLATLDFGNESYALFEYPNKNLYYLCRKVDPNFPYKYAMFIDNNKKNAPIFKASPLLREVKKKIFDGHLRCQDQMIQNKIIKYFT